MAGRKSDYVFGGYMRTYIIHLYKQIIIHKVHTIHTVQPIHNFLKRYSVRFTVIFVLSISHFTNTMCALF